MLLSEFNQSDFTTIQTLLKQCVHIPRWGAEIAKQRPFSNMDILSNFAQQQAKSWQWEEILAALNTHPRIGEKSAQATLSEKEHTFSNREQANLAQDQATLDEIFKGNVAYEKKYGFIFLIKASGLNSEQILTALNYRLDNDLDTEKRIVHQQLLDIALLRLSQEVHA